MRERIKVGEILLRAGVIDQMQLNAALGEQTRWGRRLGVTLIKLGFLEERDLVRALASQLSLPVASLEGKRIHPDILALVPASIAEEHSVIPLFTKEENGMGQLFLGMEDPSNLAVLDDLSFRTGLEVRPVMVGPSELAEAIDRAYRRDANKTPKPDKPEAAARKVEITEGTAALAAHWTLPETQAEAHVAPAPDAPLESSAPPSAVVAEQPVALPMDGQIDLPDESADDEPLPAFIDAPVGIEDEPVEQLIMQTQVPKARSAPAPSPSAATAANPYDAKTRVLVQALAQILIEEGIISRDTFHARVRELQLAEPGDT